MCFQYLLFVMCYLTCICYGQFCTQISGTAVQFSTLQVKYNGCSDSTSTAIVTKSRLDCSRSCHNEGNCVAFSYNKTSGLCSVCSDYSVKSLVVNTGPSETFYVLRQNIQHGQLTVTPNISAQLNISCGLKVGNLVALRGVFKSASGFILDMRQNYANPLFHFRPQQGQITLNHMINGQWGTGITANITSYPFKTGQNFVVHILARSDSYAMFVDGKYMCSYPYVLPLNSARYFLVSGSVQLIQLNV